MDDFERGKKLLVGAGAGMALGLAVSGSLDKLTGGVIVVVSWLVAIASLHRLGRAGSVKRD